MGGAFIPPPPPTHTHTGFWTPHAHNLPASAPLRLQKANISAGRRLAERDYRLSYILWRVWFLRRKKAQVEFEEAQRSSCAATDLEPVR